MVWVLQETTKVRILQYTILFIGKCNSVIFVFMLSLEVHFNFFKDDYSNVITVYHCRCNEQLVFSLWYACITTDQIWLAAYFFFWKYGACWYIFDCLDIYDDLISRRVHSSDAEKFAEVCPCPCNGMGWGIIWWASYHKDGFKYLISSWSSSLLFDKEKKICNFLVFVVQFLLWTHLAGV